MNLLASFRITETTREEACALMGNAGGKDLQDHRHDKRIKLPSDGIQSHTTTQISVLYINLCDPSDPKTWTLTLSDGTEKTFDPHLVSFEKSAFVNLGHTPDGRRTFLQPHKGKQFSEDEIKSFPKYDLIFPSLFYENGQTNDFTIIQKLSVHPNVFLLSNAAPLLSRANSHNYSKIFSKVSLIVDTSSSEPLDYRGLPKPAEKVLCFPVHDWTPCITVYEQLLLINEEIWSAIQNGYSSKAIIVNSQLCTELLATTNSFRILEFSFLCLSWTAERSDLSLRNVIVHCLAGYHRSACVTVSHFIYRYYFLGHDSIPFDVIQIYHDLAEIRQGVALLDFGPILEGWTTFCKDKRKVQS